MFAIQNKFVQAMLLTMKRIPKAIKGLSFYVVC